MEKNNQKAPNFVFIIIDDMGWKDLSCYGSKFYETPNIDGLAKEGVRFSEAYAASPVCSPTRASILTGKYPGRLHTTQFFGNFRSRGKMLAAPALDYLSLEEKTLPKTLKENGYSTFHVGKWHLGKPPHTPENHGYDVNVGGCHWGHPKRGFFSPYNIPTLKNGPKGEYLTDRLTDEAIKLIKGSKDKPFFLYMAYYAVHVPIEAPDHLIEKYQQKVRDLGLDAKKTFEEGKRFPCTHKKFNRITRRLIQSDPTYAAMIERLDWNIGRLLDTLKELELDENTIVIFFSDNGGLATAETSPTCNYPLSEGKGWMYEGGTRVPLIVKWPGVTEGKIESSTPIISTDFYPTILEMIGLPLQPEQHLDGNSFLSTLKGCPSKINPIFFHFPHYSNQGNTPASAIREENYKLIHRHEDDSLELYDLDKDVSEVNDLIENELEIGKKLYQKLTTWYEEVNALLPEPNPAHNKRFGDLAFKIMALGYKAYTKLSPKFKKIHRSIAKHSK